MNTAIKTLRNTTAVPQSVIYKGKQFALGPHEEQTFELEIADAFLARCSPVVIDSTEDLGAAFAPELQAKTIWVANVTGNPDAPLKVRDRRYDKDIMRYREVEVDNPNVQPRTLSRLLQGGHKQYIARDGGLVQETIPGTKYVVPPFRRVPMPEHAAEWFLNRDSLGGPGRGAAIMSRPRSNFEPDQTWELKDMRAYAKLVDPTMDLGQDEKAIVQGVKRKVEAEGKAEKWSPAKIEREVTEQGKEALRMAKHTLYRRLYFRLVDPRYTLPTRSEFNQFVSGKSAEDVEAAELQGLLDQAKSESSNSAKAGV